MHTTTNAAIGIRRIRRRGFSMVAALAVAVPLSCATVHAGLFTKSPVDHWVELPHGDVMHYTELGKSSGKVLLFVHGFPTSARLYEPIVKEICGGTRPAYRCIAVSLIGFGKSSCPDDGRMVGASYEADRLVEFIDVMGLNDFAIVVHDWGGPTGTTAALRRSEKVSHLVLLDTFMDFGQPGENDTLLALQQLFGEFFADDRPILELFPEFVELVMQTMTDRWLFLPARLDYSAPYRGGDVARCRAQAGINLFTTANDPENATVFDELAAGLPTTWAGKPARFLWATDDILLGPDAKLGQEAHAYMEALLPQAETHLIFNANHFMQEDQPKVIAGEIVDFVQ
jgi:haloalkane dehalogenase